MWRFLFIVLALFSSTFDLSADSQDEKGLPKDLVQYVRDAQKVGLATAEIREHAVKAGWAEATVNGVIEFTEGNAPPEAGTPKGPSSTLPKEVLQKEPDPTAAPGPINPQGAQVNETTGAKPAAAEPLQPAHSAQETPAAPAPGNGSESKTAKAAPESVRKDEYLIGEGDVLQISVYGEPTASVAGATVRPDGRISMPLVKDILVAGLTPSQVETIMQAQLSKAIRAPDVTVIVSQINSKKIFLTGAVKREGPLKYTYRMTVLQAISEAGGLTDYAKRKKIYILHTENGKLNRLPFDYTAVLKGEQLGQNIVLSAGDTIVVP